MSTPNFIDQRNEELKIQQIHAKYVVKASSGKKLPPWTHKSDAAACILLVLGAGFLLLHPQSIQLQEIVIDLCHFAIVVIVAFFGGLFVALRARKRRRNPNGRGDQLTERRHL